MGSNAYIQKEDLGLTVLGTTQLSYTVNGVHGQDYDTAIYKAALCRTTAIEEETSSFAKLLELRQAKLDALGEALAQLNEQIAALDSPETTTKVRIGSVASTLRRYGFDAQSTMTYADVTKLVKNVQYEMDTEDNDLQQDMTTLESFVSKRDNSMSLAQKLMKKVATTRQRGIGYIGS